MNEIAEITATRTPEIIAGEIRTFTASMLNNVIEIGRRMVEVKKLLPYGTFGKWITENTGYSSSTANNFMRLFQEYGADQGCLFGAEVECQTFGKLSYSKALALLSVPKEEREKVAVELDAEHISTRELEQALAERDEARKALQDVSARLDQAEKTIAGGRDLQAELRKKLIEAQNDVKTADAEAEQTERALKDRIRELESRPVEVAVERDEAAIREAAEAAKKAAEDAARAELDKLRARLDKAQAAEKTAKDALEKATMESGSAAADEKEAAEKARAEAEELRKKLTAAESGAGEAAIYCRAAQENMLAAVERVRRMHKSHPETAEKLLAGLEQILQGLAQRITGVKEEWTCS